MTKYIIANQCTVVKRDFAAAAPKPQKLQKIPLPVRERDKWIRKVWALAGRIRTCRWGSARWTPEGNSRYAKELFVDEAVLFGFLDGKLEHGSIEQFYHNVDTVGAGENFDARIDIVALEETVAVVRVLEEKWGGRIDFTDYLLLLKINGEWKCVAKAYNQNSDTIQQ